MKLHGFYKYILFAFLLTQPLMLFSQQKNNHNKSKQFVNRYNKLRLKKHLPLIYHDTILDNVVSKIQLNRKYKNSNGSYNEDSIRNLLYRSGGIDYQYDIKEVQDKDTLAAFTSFLLADNSNNISIGYKRSGNKHTLFKTKSYLKFDHGMVSARSDVIDALNSKITTVDVKTDSILHYFKTSIQGKYYYQFYSRIPLRTDKLDNIKKFEVQTIRIDNKRGNSNMYDLVIKSTDPNMFLIISNKNNERVVVIR